MKIVFVCPSSFNKPYSGKSLSEIGMGASWTAVINLARELAKLGHDVSVLNHCPEPGTYDGVKYLTHKIPDDLNNPAVKEALQGTEVLIVNRAGNMEWHDCLERYCGIKGYKKYLWCMDSGGAEKGRPTEFAEYDKVISISDYLNSVNIRANSDIASDYFTAIPLGVDVNLFKPSTDVNRFNVCFVGAVVSARRPQYAIDAFVAAKKIAPALPLKLHFIGSAAIWGGPPEGTSPQVQQTMAQALERAKPYENDIKFYGDIPNKKLAEILPTMGMMVYPTITETCGVTILEAQAAGVPVIVPEDSMFSAVGERVYHTETGVVRDFARMQEVGMAIVDMATNDHVYNKTRNNARGKVFRENDWTEIAARWEREVLMAKSAKDILKDREEIKNMKIGVGILSFQNRPLLEKCVNSLKQNAKMPLEIVVWDNNSIGYGCDNVAWLKANHPDITIFQAPENMYCTISRNSVVEYFRKNHPEIKYMLFSDMDVIFRGNFLYPMVEIMHSNDDCAIVAYPEANCGFRPDERGRVSEVMSICNLHRLSSFDIFPNPNRPFDETFKVYSFDSWVCQMLNLLDWHTYLVMGKKGYDHVGGQINQFLKKADDVKSADVKYWQSMADSLSIKKRWEDKQAADYICIGNGLKTAGEAKEAEMEYREGISRFPDNHTLQYCLGNLYKDRSEWRKAMECYINASNAGKSELQYLYLVEEMRRKIIAQDTTKTGVQNMGA